MARKGARREEHAPQVVNRTNMVTRIAIAAILGVAYSYFYQGGGWNQNTRFALVRAILSHGTLRIDDTAMVGGRPVSGDLARYDGHLYSDKAPGVSFMAVPFVLASVPFVSDPDSREGIATLSWVATMAAAGLPTVLAALLVFEIACGLGLGTAAGAFAALTFGLATPAWAYATLMFGHALAAACLVVAFAAALALQRDEGPRRDLLLGLAVGLGGGWATVTEYPCAIPAAMLALLALAIPDELPRRTRIGAATCGGAVACAAVLAWHNTAAFGSPLTLGYAQEVGNFEGMKQGFLGVSTPSAHAFYGILFGRYRGLLYHAPVLALAPFGLGLLASRPASRKAAVTAIAIVAYFVLLNSAYYYWFGGAVYGPRHLSPALPFLALGLAVLWRQLPRPARIAMAALAAACGFVTLVAVSTTAQCPEWFQAPWWDQNWPAFREGQLALNYMSFLDNDAVPLRDPVAHAWNLGEKIGLAGLWSLVPLLASWTVIVAAWWMAIGRQPDAPANTPHGAI